MKPAPSLDENRSSESGQAAVLVALFLFFVFLILASLAIDGSITYLARRDLQNVADSATLSACRVLTSGGSDTDAVEAAKKTIQDNLGSWAAFAGSNPPSSNTGSGTGLAQGIEAANPQVRIALIRTVPTVLNQFLGRDQTLIDAKARCDSTAGGGLMPIAVQRYDGGKDGTLRDHIANKAASGGSPQNPTVPYPDDSILTTVPGHYGPFQVFVPMSQYTPSDGALSDPNTGAEVPLLGNSAATNNPPNSMSGLVMLDIRNVGSSNALEYYNGVDGQTNSNKSVSREWIYQHGYPGPYPNPGTEIAILDGVSANFGPQAMTAAGYRVGDVVPAIIYDGYVWTTPDYAITLTPTAGNPNGITGGYPDTAATAVGYTLSIVRTGAANAVWFTPLNFDLKFEFSNGNATLPAGTHLLVNGTDITLSNFTYNLYNITEAAGWSGSVLIYTDSAGPSPITQTVQYLSGLNLVARASTGLAHGASSNYGFGAITLPDYTLRSDDGEVVVRQDSSTSAAVISFGASTVPNGGCNNVTGSANVMLGGTIQPWVSFFSSSQTVKLDIDQSEDNQVNLSLTATPNALTGNYTLRVTLPASACGPGHSVEIPLKILTPATNATPNRFVFVQGYVLFRLSFVDSNDVKGYAISPLYFDFSQIRQGLRARLVPWQ